MLYLSFYLLCLLFNKIGEPEGRTCSVQEVRVGMEGGGGMAQTMYTHMNKCKNNKKCQSTCAKNQNAAHLVKKIKEKMCIM
jgi:hypothetical protein